MYPPFGNYQAPSGQQPQERRAHILDLISQLPDFRPTNRDQSVFEGPARLRDGRTTTLRVTLSPNFPQVRPHLGVSHPLQHQWVDQAGQLSCPGLTHWGPHSRLSAVVQEALQGLSGQGTPSASSSRPASPMESSPSKAATAPTDFPQLQTLSNDQLQELLFNKEAFLKLADSVIEDSQPMHVKKLLARGNMDLAQANLEREGEVGEIKNQIAIIRSSEYAAAKEAFDVAYTRQEAILQKIKPQALIEALGEKAAEADEAAEKLHEDMMQRNVPIEGFLGPFIAQKKLFHQRELKQQAAQQIF